MGKGLSKQWAESKRNEGNKVYSKGEYKKALKIYSFAIWLAPTEIEYYGNRVSCYMMLKDYKNALKDLYCTIKLNETYVKGYFRMIKCYLALGDISGTEYAIKCYKNVIKNLSDETTITSIAEYEENLLKLNDLQISTQAHFHNKSYESCLSDLEKFLNISPECLSMKCQKVECLILLNKLEESKEILEKSLKILTPNSIEVFYLSLLYSYNIGELAKCIAEYENKFKIMPDHMKINILYNEAKFVYDKNIQANELIECKNFDQAAIIYTQTIEYQTLSQTVQSKLYFNRASAYFKKESYFKALTDCEKALNISPNFLQALYISAKCNFELYFLENCVKLCEKILEISISEEIKELLKKAELEINKRDEINRQEEERKRRIEEERKRQDRVREEQRRAEERKRQAEWKREEDRRRETARRKEKERQEEEDRNQKEKMNREEERKRDEERKRQEEKYWEERKRKNEEEKKRQEQGRNRQEYKKYGNQEREGNNKEGNQQKGYYQNYNYKGEEQRQNDNKEYRQNKKREANKRRRQRKRKAQREEEQQRKQDDQRRQQRSEEEQQRKQKEQNQEQQRRQEEQRKQEEKRQQNQQQNKPNANNNSRSFVKDTKGYYKTMNLNTNASSEEIQFAYKSLAKQHHPDKHPNSPAKEQNQEIFKRITEAYRILSDTIMKYDYDRS